MNKETSEKVKNIQEKYPIIRKLFPKEIRRIDKGRCPFCDKVIKMKDFRNSISRKEFKISGICQECQDKVFGKD